MVDLIANIIGAVGAIIFAEFLAYKIGAPPLIIILVATVCVMIYSFYNEMRKHRARRVPLEREQHRYPSASALACRFHYIR